MNENFMKERPVLPLLLSMLLPMVLSMMVNSLYHIVYVVYHKVAKSWLEHLRKLEYNQRYSIILRRKRRVAWEKRKKKQM